MKAATLITSALLSLWGCTPPPQMTATSPNHGETAARGPASAPAAAHRPAKKPVVICGASILISHRDAKRPAPQATRTRKEARDLVLALATRARNDPSTFAALARKHSDGPWAARGGFIGAWIAGQMPYFDRHILALEVGAVSVPKISPHGFLLLRRLPPPPLLAASHILIGYKGTRYTKASRNKEQARQLAATLALQAGKDPTTFESLARKHSDCPTASKGGTLGIFPRGRMVPAFEEAVEALTPGQVSGVVETPFGFHVIRRDAIP